MFTNSNTNFNRSRVGSAKPGCMAPQCGNGMRPRMPNPMLPGRSGSSTMMVMPQRVYGQSGQSYGNYQPPPPASNYGSNWAPPVSARMGQCSRARSTPVGISRQIPNSNAQFSPSSQMGIPAEVAANPNTQYIRMNWEDILGGKNGMEGLRISMPSGGDPNGNRQIRIGLGGAGGQESNDGSTPLRIMSFQPVENYPGMIAPTPPQPGQPKFSVMTGENPKGLYGQQQQH